MVKEIIWSPESERTFFKVIEYLRLKWTEREVANFIEATENIIKYISVNPLMFRKTNIKNIHEALVTPHNLLIYKIYSDKIFLITFYDTRQSPKKKILKLK
jgi:plasmid stabilization system protein ParE